MVLPFVFSRCVGANDHDMTTGLGGQSLDHWRGVIWDPGIVGQPCIRMCYDCLCLMALFRGVMLSVHDWVVWSVWTGTESGYCRTITWELGYLCSLYTPCDVDRLCTNMTQEIKEYKVDVVAQMTVGNDNDSLQWCAYVRGTSMGVLSAGRIPIMMIGRFGCGGGPVGCSNWLRVRGTVVISPGGVRIGYVRRALCGRSSTDAAPVTGSLVFSAPLDCFDVYIVLLNLLRVGCFAVRIVSGLLDLDYSSGKLAYIGLWRRKVWRWWRTVLVSPLGWSSMLYGTPRRLWWISIQKV